MLQKDLKQSSLDNTMPALASAYINASLHVYGIKVTVVKSKWSRFAVFEDDLRELHIPIRDYAFTVSTILKAWCVSHKFGCVPVNVFTGDWALVRFLKVWQSKTVTIDRPSNYDELLYSELLVARMYIATLLIRYVRLSFVVEDIKAMLTSDWYHMYVSKDKRRSKFISMAIPILCEEFGVIFHDDITTYNDIVRKLS